MTGPVRWYLAVQLLGLLAFRISARHTCALPDKGYAASKCLGVLLCGYLLWIGTSLGLLRNEAGGALLVVAAMAGAAVAERRRSRGSAQAFATTPPMHVVVVTEVLFLAAFAGWCAVRYLDPAVDHTEQPMDLMLLTAVANAPTYPVQDPWLANYPVGYYYLGYWFMATIGHLAGVPASLTYNVGQAAWLGLLATTSFGVGFNLTALSLPGRRTAAMWGGALAVVAVTLAGNLWMPAERLASAIGRQATTSTDEHWWWWRASRTLHDADLTGAHVEVISEFPFFSYLLGDNHPHLLSMPFLALTATLACAIFLRRRDPGGGDAVPPGTRAPQVTGLLLLTALVASSSVALNSWDAPTAVLLVAAGWLCATAPPFPRSAWRQALSVAAMLGAAMLWLNVPYFLTAQSQVIGLLPNLFHPTPLSRTAVALGSVAPGAVLLLAAAWTSRAPSSRRAARLFLLAVTVAVVWLCAGAVWAAQSSRGLAWLARVAPDVPDVWAIAAGRWAAGWPTLVIGLALLAAAVTLLAGGRAGSSLPPGQTFGVLLVAFGLALVVIPELVYVHDGFASRMNTIFKLHYQAWLLLGTSGALGIVVSWARGGWLRAGSVAAAVALACGLVYPPIALTAKVKAGATKAGNLDALAYLSREEPDTYAAIGWVLRHTRPGAVVVQAAGRSYDARDGLISVATGRPTLLGWEGHERQWRGTSYSAMAAGRHEALGLIYNPQSEADLARVLSAWNVSFVVVGPRERTRYGMQPGHEATIGRAMSLAFQRGAVRIFMRRG
jgi:YYY domain-containing protein